MEKEMLKGYVDAIILSILNHGDSYGFEITKIINEKTLGLFELKEGTLYPALKRLELNAHIEGYWDVQPLDGRPRRKYYRINESGKKKLNESKTSWKQNISIINIFLGGVANVRG